MSRKPMEDDAWAKRVVPYGEDCGDLACPGCSPRAEWAESPKPEQAIPEAYWTTGVPEDGSDEEVSDG